MKPRILIVDDHEIVRTSIGSLLASKWGYEICGDAGDGMEAIAEVHELKPDLVLLDLSMPVMGGTAVARLIRAWEPTTKIVFLTMHDSEMAAELARLAGVEASVSKRCSMEELNKVIANLFEPSSSPSTIPQSHKRMSQNASSIDHFEQEKQAFFGRGPSDQTRQH